MSIGIYVGVDIAANSIQLEWVAVSSQQREQVTIQHKQGDYRKVVKRLTHHMAATDIQVVMEATGSYWMAFAEYLHQAGLVVSVLNPIQSARFAQMLLQRAKTDVADASPAVRVRAAPPTARLDTPTTHLSAASTPFASTRRFGANPQC